jgi:small subunit ribosomal protein S8
MQTDPIADMLTRIRNANRALHERAEMPSSRLKSEIARILKEEGYIQDYRVEHGRRVYAGKDRLPRVLGGMGISILSTSNGLITSRAAEEQGVGGEVICFVW